MEFAQVHSIVWTEDAHGDYCLTLKFRPGLTTMLRHATQFTPSTTPSFKPDWYAVKGPRSTSQTSPASSAPTSSNTQGSEGSLSSTSNPDSWIEAALKYLETTLESKNQDYRIDGEFSNFEYTAALVDAKVEDVILTQIGIKMGRLNGLRRSGGIPDNEPLLDTYKDLAGYAIILYAYALKESE